MRIVSYNVNGIRSIIPSRFATLGDLLNSLGNPNIFCAQESKLSQNPQNAPKNALNPAIFTADLYEIFFHSSETKKGYSGVFTAVLISSGLPKYVFSGINLEFAAKMEVNETPISAKMAEILAENVKNCPNFIEIPPKMAENCAKMAENASKIDGIGSKIDENASKIDENASEPPFFVEYHEPVPFIFADPPFFVDFSPENAAFEAENGNFDPKRAEIASKMVENGSNLTENGSKMAENDSKTAENGLKRPFSAENGPEKRDFPLKNRFLDLEGRVLTVDFGTFCVVNCYFPNSAGKNDRIAYKLLFCQEIRRFLNLLYARGREVILLGDINICHREIDLWNPQAAISASQSGFLPCERTFLDHLTSVFPPFSDAFRLKNGENTVEFGGS
eukprot:TRINITY_DN12177_c0_g1_i2.p1 TRINITY_DN12177_c0_g1~~TRINITY_DN12177_c0_g1_i2.p1  ORF type:complete len:390 (-),score=48.49 TRINITY_DN12177_c0_g1_i2:68-1237(-)